jgi:hypothetical protein
MVTLRLVALASNLAFFAYGYLGNLIPSFSTLSCCL